MIVSLLIVWLFASPLWSPSWPIPQSTWTPGPVSTNSERRLFSMRAREAWIAVQQRIDELGFTIDKIDRQHQVMLTKWRAVGDPRAEWLPSGITREPYIPTRIRYVIFVSPFAEPARISIGSIVEAKHRGTALDALAYNPRPANVALMRELTKALGEDGQPLPADREGRRKLALSILKDEADECVRERVSLEGAKPTRPQRIRLSEFELLYPAPAAAVGKQGIVKLAFEIVEDGTVTNIRLLGTPPGADMEASAIGAVSLLLYTPAKVGNCRVPMIADYTANYSFR